MYKTEEMQNHVYETDMISTPATIRCVCLWSFFSPQIWNPLLLDQEIWFESVTNPVWFGGDGCMQGRGAKFEGQERFGRAEKVALVWKIWICNYPLQFILKHRIYIDNFWQHIWKYISLKVVRNLWSWSWSWSGSCSGWRSWWWSWPGPWAGHYEKCSTSRIAKCFGILVLVVCIELEIREGVKKISFLVVFP